MTTENLTPSDHRQALQQLLHASRLPHHLNAFALVPGPTAAAAIEWALEQTQEPAPPPGGWLDLLPKPQDCIEQIEIIERSATEAAISIGGWASLSKMPKPTRTYLAIQWALPILRRAANLTQGPMRESQDDPTDPTEAIVVLETAREAAFLQETGSGEPKPPKPRHLRIALGWALSILQCRCDPPAPEAKIEITTHEWIPALVALTKRELRFWREAGEVSGNVTRRAASRAIRGLEQIIKTIPANQREG